MLMHEIQFWLGWGAYSAHPDPVARFKGPTYKGKEGRDREGEGEWEWSIHNFRL